MQCYKIMERKNGRKEPSQKEKGYLPFPLNRHPSSLRSYRADLPHVFLPPSRKVHLWAATRQLYFPLFFLLHMQSGQFHKVDPVPQETNTSPLLRAFKNIKAGSCG